MTVGTEVAVGTRVVVGAGETVARSADVAEEEPSASAVAGVVDDDEQLDATMTIARASNRVLLAKVSFTPGS